MSPSAMNNSADIFTDEIPHAGENCQVSCAFPVRHVVSSDSYESIDDAPPDLLDLSSASYTPPQKRNKSGIEYFQSLVHELEFDPEHAATSSISNDTTLVASERTDEHVDVAKEDDEPEDTNIRYPYQRKDSYDGLIQRINTRLEDGSLDMPSVDEKFEEARQKTIMMKEKEKFEKKVTREGKRYGKDSIYTCIICAKAFPTGEDLYKHTNTEHDLSTKRFSCKKCNQSFKYLKNLKVHEEKHLAKPEFECKECFMVFRSHVTLEAHLARQHQKNADGSSLDIAELVFCSNCGEKFVESQMKRHEYYCFNKKRILEQRAEKKSTSSVPPSPAFSVASCSSFSSLPFSPSVSPKVSYVDKSCPICNETFASRQSMIRHIGRKHPEHTNDPNSTNVRYVSVQSPSHQYACEDCGKRFTTRAGLSTHRERIHLKSRSYECDLCHKSYPLPSELRKHQKRVHGKSEAEEPSSDLTNVVF